MKVARWGNSLAVRLPKGVADELGLKEGDEVQVVRGAGGALTVDRDARREEVLRRIRDLSHPESPGFRFDRDALYEDARGGFRAEGDDA